jgi:hypothetical protein
VDSVKSTKDQRNILEVTTAADQDFHACNIARIAL